MEISEAVRTRRSIRSYKPDPVPQKVLEDILETAKWAGSGTNTQPWELTVIGAELMKSLKAEILKRIEADDREPPEAPFVPPPEPYASRAEDYRNSTDSYQFPPGTEDLDEKRRVYGLTVETFRGAPNAIVLSADKSLGMSPHMLMAIGIMCQTIALTALDYGLGTCIMAARWPNLMKARLGIPEDKNILMFVGIGYPDLEARINNFPRKRLPLDSFVSWKGF